MINFFRKTRKKLADDNKFFKYSRYAIGEIVLVVVGILIALSINNWNQIQLNHKKEITILKALKKEFKENSIRYTKTIKKQELVISKSRTLLQCLEKKDLNFKRDSIGIFIAGGAFNFYRTEPIVGTYEALNGSGDINLIQNELLKSKLATFSSEIIQGFEDEITSMNLANQLTHEFSATYEPLMPTRDRKRYGLKKARNMDVEYQNKVLLKMYQNPNIMTPLIRKILCENNRLTLQNKMLTYSDEILDLIDDELKIE